MKRESNLLITSMIISVRASTDIDIDFVSDFFSAEVLTAFAYQCRVSTTACACGNSAKQVLHKDARTCARTGQSKIIYFVVMPYD